MQAGRRGRKETGASSDTFVPLAEDGIRLCISAS